MGRAMLSKSLIKFSVDGLGCVPSLLFDLRLDYGGGNEDNDDLLQKVPCMHCHTVSLTLQQSPANQCLCQRLLDTVRSGSVSCGVTAPFSWIVVHTRFCLCLPSVSPVLYKFYNQIPLASKVKFSGGSQSLCQIPRLGNLGPRAFLTV